jgi:glycosyltransferase involved in cell wall biosynthesis
VLGAKCDVLGAGCFWCSVPGARLTDSGVKILSITAGAAGMYCGSCLRDNALAVELLARGHDVTLLPLYTPTNPDETNVSHERVLFGGISIYLQQYSRVFRRLPRFLDRLWDSPRVIKALAGRSLSTDPRLLGDLTISMLEGDRGVLRKEFAKLLDWMSAEPTPDVINLPNSLLIGLARPLRDAVRRPIVCTLQGEDLFLDGLIEPYRHRAIDLIREQVGDVDRFLSVSEYYAPVMAGLLKIPSQKMAVVPLGINLQGYDAPRKGGRHSSGHDIFRVGYFARIAPEKGLHVLADAYIRLRQRTGSATLALEAARRGIHLSRHGRSRRKARVSQDARRPLGASSLRRTEGGVPAGSDGQRRPGRTAAARGVHGDRGEHRRRPAGRARRSGRARGWTLRSVERSPARCLARGPWLRGRSPTLQYCALDGSPACRLRRVGCRQVALTR